MTAQRRRGSAQHEFALNVALFTCVATIGWTSPTAFHDALMGVTELASAHLSAAPVREGVPTMLAMPRAVVVPLWSEPTAAERQEAECADRNKVDPWTSDACEKPADAPVDAKPWAATPWGRE